MTDDEVTWFSPDYRPDSVVFSHKTRNVALDG